jgi:hypothetical protein
MMMLSLTSTLLLADDDINDDDDVNNVDDVNDVNDADANDADDERRRKSSIEEEKNHVSTLAPIESSDSWCAAPSHH